MPADADLIFISLLEPLEDALALARLLDSLQAEAAAVPACMVPPIRGVSYFTEGVGPSPAARPSRRVHLLMSAESLAGCTTDVTGVFIVGVAPGSTHSVDPRWHLVATDVDGAPLALAEAAMRLFTPTSAAAGPTVFKPGAAALLGSVCSAELAHGVRGSGLEMAQPPPRRPGPRARPSLPPLLETVEAPIQRPTDPFDLLVDASTRRHAVAGPPPLARRAGASAVRRLPAWAAQRRPASGSVTERLAEAIVARAPTIVVVGSRKGGVGKTSHAAGIAIAAGTVLDSVGHRAAIVDANIANPDAWGYFDLPAEAPTVRTLAAALARGQAGPRPVNARTPALACFPETRDGAEYSRTDIRRLAAHLRERFAFVVVDMSNRLPDPTAGPEAAAAAFWLDEADVLVLPTACSRQDFNAVLDFLDVDDLPPVVVPCLVPGARRNRRHPVTQQYLAEIGARVDCIVELPDEADRVRLAGMEGVAVQDVSPALRSGYRRLTEAIVALPERRRG